MLTSIYRAFQTENIKARHTKTLWLLIILSIFIPGLIALLHIFGVEDLAENMTGSQENFADLINSLASAFSMFLYPMGIVLISAQVASVEHKNSTWQLIETQPLAKSSIFLGKYLMMMKNIVIFIILFYSISHAIFYLIYLIDLKADGQHYYSIPVVETIFRIVNMICAGAAYSALFFILHINIKKTNLISTLGIVSILGYMIAQGFQFEFPRWFPLLLMSTAAGEVSQVGEWITYFSRISLVEAVIILLIGFLFYKYQSHRYNLLKSRKGLITLIGIMALGSVVIYFMQLPRTQKSHGHTVISGHIDTDDLVNEIIIKDLNTQSTIIRIPVDSLGNFHANIDTIDIKKSFYSFALAPSNKILMDNNSNDPAMSFLTNGDSIHVSYINKNEVTNIKISGDRRAESSGRLITGPAAFPNIAKLKEYNPDKGASINALKDQFLKYIDNDLKSTKKHITIDGYISASDLIDYQNNLIKAFYLKEWNRIMGEFFPNDSATTFTEIEDIKKSINSDDNDLWLVDGFLAYQLSVMSGNNKVKDVDILELLENIKDQERKQIVTTYALKSILNNTTIEDHVAIELYNKHIQGITNNEHLRSLNRAHKGRLIKMNKDVMPEFTFHDENGQTQKLSQFLGKYIVLDIWATWCGPCLYNAPFIKDLAEKYKDNNIKFVAVSIDQNVDAWKSKIRDDKNIVNWISEIDNPFIEYVGIEDIPRYLLISPEGMMINHQLPEPSSHNFEDIIKRFVQ